MPAMNFPASPTLGQVHVTAAGRVFTYDGTGWRSGLTGYPGAIISVSPPSSPAPGLFWFRPDLGSLFIWYDDGDSAQWVEAVTSPQSDEHEHDAAALTSGVLDAARLPGTSNMNGRLAVQLDGTLIGTRRTLNIIADPSMLITPEDDAANERVKLTLKSKLRHPYVTRLQLAANVTLPNTTWTRFDWGVEIKDELNLHDNSVNPARMTLPTDILATHGITEGRFRTYFQVIGADQLIISITRGASGVVGSVGSVLLAQNSHSGNTWANPGILSDTGWIPVLGNQHFEAFGWRQNGTGVALAAATSGQAIAYFEAEFR